VPKYVTPNGRADLDRTAEDLMTHLRRRARGVANIVGTKELTEAYDIKPWQIYTCMLTVKNNLRPDGEVLCSRTGPGGGWFIAETEEEARLFGLRRTETALTILENTVDDMAAALMGVVRSEPLMEPYWKRTRNRLVNVAQELTKVRYELAVAALDAGDAPEDETPENE
jgi:hypothetical protein